MLHPQERHSLTEALRPPTGWKLDRAIGTTYSLDLMTLLTVPLSFTFFDIEDAEGKPIADPIRVMESLRRYAHRVHVFCQSGGICLSKPNRLLSVFIEDSVHEVKAPRGGVFHPKVWALRFVDADERVMYRLLVSSRNLTFDRSWDTIICLEGMVSNRKNAFAMNHPLGDFIASLPDFCIYNPGSETRRAVEQFSHELRRTVFESPEGLDLLAFHPLGFEGERMPGLDDAANVITIISPFLSAPRLRELIAEKDHAYIISRRESLDQLPRELIDDFDAVYIMDQAVDTELESEEGGEEGEEKPEDLLSGLHAKCYIVEQGHHATIYSGSANATSAAFGRNVEMLVALKGGKWVFGSEGVFGTKENPSDFMKLLRPYVRSGEATPPDPLEAAFEELRENVVHMLTDASLRAQCVSTGEDRYTLTLTGKMKLGRRMPGDAELRCRPLSLPENFNHLVNAADKLDVVFPGISFEAITSFFAFELLWEQDDRRFAHRFVLNVPLTGAPQDRTAQVMGYLLKDEKQVMRLLLMILGITDPTEMAGTGGAPIDGTVITKLMSGSYSTALFELLVRAVARHPEKIKDIDGIVGYLRKAGNGTSLLPDGFEEIWQPILEAGRKGRRA